MHLFLRKEEVMALFLLFSVITTFREEFLKGPFLVLHFCYYIMAFLMMLPVILISMLHDDTAIYPKCDQATDL